MDATGTAAFFVPRPLTHGSTARRYAPQAVLFQRGPIFLLVLRGVYGTSSDGLDDWSKIHQRFCADLLGCMDTASAVDDTRLPLRLF